MVECNCLCFYVFSGNMLFVCLFMYFCVLVFVIDQINIKWFLVGEQFCQCFIIGWVVCFDKQCQMVMILGLSWCVVYICVNWQNMGVKLFLCCVDFLLKCQFGFYVFKVLLDGQFGKVVVFFCCFGFNVQCCNWVQIGREYVVLFIY